MYRFLKRLMLIVSIVLALPIVAAIIIYVFLSGDLKRYESGDYPLADKSTFTVDTMKITLERYSSHPLLAEYTRFITVDSGNGAPLRTEIGQDSGGADRIDLCRVSNGDILLQDRFYSYLLSSSGALRELSTASATQVFPDGTTKVVIVPDQKPGCIKKIGRLDRLPSNGYGFIPEI